MQSFLDLEPEGRSPKPEALNTKPLNLFRASLRHDVLRVWKSGLECVRDQSLTALPKGSKSPKVGAVYSFRPEACVIYKLSPKLHGTFSFSQVLS